jgi:type II secretory pathway pseudopilin PulG
MDKTVSRIFSGPLADRNRLVGFTLVEVLIGATLSGFVLAGVLSAFLMMGRMGANIQNYTEIESKARQSLEQFSREVRLAYAIAGTTLNNSSVTLNIPDTTANRTGTGSGAYNVTYTFEAANNQLTRAVNGGTPVPFITGIQLIPGTTSFFKYYRLLNPENFDMGEGYLFNSAVAGIPREARQIEVSFVLQRKSVTVATASNKVLSARFILRNK